jgi:hypothetical protein
MPNNSAQFSPYQIEEQHISTPLATDIELSAYRVSRYDNASAISQNPCLRCQWKLRRSLLVFRHKHRFTIKSSGFADIKFPFSSFGDTLDVLRNEKPVYLNVQSDGSAELKTSDEAVGETGV